MTVEAAVHTVGDTALESPRRQRRARPRRPWLRRLAIGVTLVVVAVAGSLVWIDRQHDFAVDLEEVSFTFDGDTIVGTLAVPRSGGPHGLVVFVHGDGPANADRDGGYLPLWEAFARAGYASLSWDSPGVGRSGGDWLDFSMSARADLAVAAIDSIVGRDDIDGDNVGLWGASQAGWVMPKIANQYPSTRFMIAVSPAINWLDQGRYNLRSEMQAEGASQAEIAEAIEYSDSVRVLLRRGAPYQDYLALATDPALNRGSRGEPMTEPRWRFVSANFESDARADLDALAERSDISVLLQVAGQDINVDVADTQEVYQRILGERVDVRSYPDADHSMVRSDLADKGLRFTLTWLFAPTTVYADGYLAESEAFLTAINNERGN